MRQRAATRDFAAVLWLLLAVLVGGGYGQVDTGTITGTLRDPSGAVITGATVKITSATTGFEIAATTNMHGQYVSPPLRPAPYSVSAAAPGFRRTVTTVTLTLNQRAVIDLTLPLGEVGEQVNVTAQAVQLESESATVGNLRDQEAIQGLPLNTRNFNQLIGLATGVVPGQTQAANLALTATRGSTDNSVNGLTFRANRYMVDGIDNSENHNGRGIMIYPPVDAIQEFRVQTSAATAEFGRGGGGSINVYFKSGSNQVHGNLFEYFRNSALDARNFFAQSIGAPPFRMNQFGGTVGGPVRRNRTFFFFSYEGERRRQALTYLVTVPMADFRQGIFSAHPNRIFDPLTTRPAATGSGRTRDQFPGNSVPASRIDGIARKLINLYPAPNRQGLVSNYGTSPSQSLNRNTFDFKVDHHFGSHDQTFFRYSRHGADQDVPGSLPLPAVGSTAAGASRYPLHQFVASHTHTLSPARINEFRAGVTRLRIESRNPNWERNVSDEIGIPGVNVPGDPYASGLSRITVSGFEGLGDAGNKPAIIVSENYQWNDTFTWVRGSHTYKFGGEIERRRYNVFQTASTHGTLTFGPVYTTQPSSPGGTGISLADLLLGTPQSGTIAYVTGTRGYRRTEWGLFLQDTWKLTPALTLNYGLRYEVFNAYPWKEVANRMAYFRPDLAGVFIVGSPEVPQASGTNTDYNNFGPRVGLAYKLGNRTALRAAYGLFYSAEAISAQGLGGGNPPFVGSSAFNNDQFDFAGARRLDKGFYRPPGLVFSPLGADLFGIDMNFRTPYAQQWNAGIQRELAANVLLSLSYVGTAGKKLVLNPDVNQAAPGPGAVTSRRPYPRFNAIALYRSEGSSVYHSLQVSAERRLGRQINFLASYTWAHGIDDGGFQAVRQNLNDLRSERGSGVEDLRHRLVLSWTWSLPFLARNRWLGGWQLNGIAHFYTGLPFTPGSAINTLNGSGDQRPDRIGSGKLERWSVDRYFDITAFRTPAPFRFGNSGRNILSGPGTEQYDAAAIKNFRVLESRGWRLQLRGEFFNLANRPQFNNPNASIGSQQAGRITAAGSQATFQRTSRQVQLALKFYF